MHAASLGVGNPTAVAQMHREQERLRVLGTDSVFGAASASSLRAALRQSQDRMATSKPPNDGIAAQSVSSSSDPSASSSSAAMPPSSADTMGVASSSAEAHARKPGQHLAHSPSLCIRGVSARLSEFVKKSFSVSAHRPCVIRALEAGGGGDCLFHSFAAALEQMLQLDPSAAKHVLNKIPMEVFTGSKDRAVAQLRSMSASCMDHWHPERFLDYVVGRSIDQALGPLGGFRDGWDPIGLLHTCGFHCLVGCESVLAFGDAVDGDPGDVSLRVARTEARFGAGGREERIELVVQGRSKLAELRQCVKAELKRSGNWHWGDQFDVQNLSNALDVGVLMFCDQLQDGGRQCLYNIGSQREDFPYWIALWWDEPMHFRLAQLSRIHLSGTKRLRMRDEFVSNVRSFYGLYVRS